MTISAVAIDDAAQYRKKIRCSLNFIEADHSTPELIEKGFRIRQLVQISRSLQIKIDGITVFFDDNVGESRFTYLACTAK